MDKFTFKTKGVCSKEIVFRIENGRLADVAFLAGCSGNLQGISKLVEGMPVGDAIKKLRGIDCDGRGTSCPDQLSKALEEVLDKIRDKAAG